MNGSLRFAFIPPWPRNPYQRRLARALAAFDVEVLPGRRSWLLHPGRLRARDVDGVHIHDPAELVRDKGPGAAAWRAVRVLAGIAWLRVRGVTVVWTAHDLEGHDRRFPRIERAFGWALSRLASGILTHGDAATRAVAERFGLSRARRGRVSRLRAIRAPAMVDGPPDDAAAARRRLLPDCAEDDLVLLFLGSVKEYRGVPELLEAFTRVARPGLRLVIRGATKDPALARTIEGAQTRCSQLDFVPGFVPEPEVVAWLAAADVVVAPYRRILTSGSVSLAMASGRPCIAPRMGTIPEYLDDDCGFLYDAEDPLALEKALVRAIDSRARLEALGARARERAGAFRWSDAARETAAFYRGLRAPERGRPTRLPSP